MPVCWISTSGGCSNLSIDLTRRIDRENPGLLQRNLGSTCFEFARLVIAALTAEGRRASHIAKTRGEGQFTPPGFEPREVKGLDGKTYFATGVSHDAIWVDGIQVDLIARANDTEQALALPDGGHMVGIPVWNEIRPEFWRPNNPPLDLGGLPAPKPQPKPEDPTVPTDLTPIAERLDDLQRDVDALRVVVKHLMERQETLIAQNDRILRQLLSPPTYSARFLGTLNPTVKAVD